jgi:DNA-binding response OmpR family regulator
VLIAEDHRDIADSVAYSLGQEGYEVEVARDGEGGLAAARGREPDLIILDLMLPGMGGLDVFRAIRRHSVVPVIMLTAKAGEADRVTGIELGADDYITKPFSMRELVARVRMVLRRASARDDEATPTLRSGDLEIDTDAHTVTLGGRPLELAPREFALLVVLARNAGRALTRGVLLEQAWGTSEYIDERTVDVHVRWLRRKIEKVPASPERILTVRGMGYRFVG